MLSEFLEANREELVRRCRAKVAMRPVPQATDAELKHGIPLFLEQLISTLRAEQSAPRSGASQLPAEIGVSAGKHGNELLRHGFTVDQVVHDYGDLCQSVTELAAEQHAPVTVDEFRTFNRLLDNAIADAVSEFGRQRDHLKSAEGVVELNERLGALTHELRNHLAIAILAFDAIKSGNVAVTGATGAVLDRSLLALRSVIDRSLADVRLSAGLAALPERIVMHEFVAELEVSAAMDARARGISFVVEPLDNSLVIEADKQMLHSAVSNLLQNAFKFSRPEGRVQLLVHATTDRIRIEVEDAADFLTGRAKTCFRRSNSGATIAAASAWACRSAVARSKPTVEPSTFAIFRARAASSRSIFRARRASWIAVREATHAQGQGRPPADSTCCSTGGGSGTFLRACRMRGGRC